MNVWRLISKTVSLREAASAIFGISTLLPILLLVSFLSRHDLLGKLEAQLSLLAAVALAVFGFVALRRMVDRISTLVNALGAPTPVEEAGSLGGFESPIPGLGAVAEIGQLRDFLSRLLVDLRSSTERLEDLVFKQGTLNEMVEVAARIPEMKDLLALVLERTMRTVRAAVGSIMLVDRERQNLRIVAARGVAESALADVGLCVGGGIAGRVAQLGEPIVVDDVEAPGIRWRVLHLRADPCGGPDHRRHQPGQERAWRGQPAHLPVLHFHGPSIPERPHDLRGLRPG